MHIHMYIQPHVEVCLAWIAGHVPLSKLTSPFGKSAQTNYQTNLASTWFEDLEFGYC